MHNTSVKTFVLGRRAGKKYDVETSVLIHYQGSYKERVEFFKRYGLFNMRGNSIHVTIIASEGDASSKEEILAGWPPGVDVTFLEFATATPIPKIHGYYEWLKNAGLHARWYLRVDDDSITDVGALLQYVNHRYGGMPIHLMTTPHENEGQVQQFRSLLQTNGITLETLIHEHESSISSSEAMNIVFEHPGAMRIMGESGQYLSSPGDQALALCMQIAGVPVAGNPCSYAGFARDRLYTTGGSLSHIHYVDWNDDDFVANLEAMLYGQRDALDENLIDQLVGRPISFGRCFGIPIADLMLRSDGTIAGSEHDNESRWCFRHGLLLFTRTDGIATTIFSSVIREDAAWWLLGPHLHLNRHIGDTTTHYIKVSAETSKSKNSS